MNRSRSPRARAFPALALILTLATPSFAIDPAKLARGIVHPIVPTTTDPGVSYALYLPTTFEPSRSWPILLIFDPRGRGEVSTEIFRQAAERLGWIIASSNNTESDVPTWDSNLRAVNTMLPELAARLPLDARRVYAAGMSGTAVLAWIVGQKTEGLAGVIAVGGRPTPGYETDPPKFALWAAAGRLDFNHDPTEQLFELAGKGDRPHRFEVFDGPHGWFGADEAGRALDWLEVVAIREQRRAADPELVAETLAADLAGVDPLLAAGNLLGGLRRLRAIEQTYSGLADIATVETRRKQLEGDPALKAAVKDVNWGKRFEAIVFQRVLTIERRLRSDDTAIFGRMRTLLNIPEIVETAALDGPRGEAGRRALATAHIQFGFYQSRTFMAAGEYADAATVLRLALELRPEDGTAWYNLACAEARRGDAKEALAALGKAIDLGVGARQSISEDPDLESLHGQPEFAALMARASGG